MEVFDLHRIEAYSRTAIIFIVIMIILYLPILFRLKNKGIKPIRQVSYIGLFCSAFLIIFATILCTPITFEPEKHFLNLIPFNWRENGLKQFFIEELANIILFIPLGFFLPAVFRTNRKAYKTILIIFATTFSIEFFQYFIGRLTDIDDIITNLLGGIIGYMIFKTMDRFLEKRKAWNRFVER